MAPQQEIRVGYGPRDYGSFRTFQRVPVPGVTFVREPYLPIRQLQRMHRKLWEFAGGVGLFLPTGRTDLYHSFNAIPLNRSPWVVTFECQLPRVWNAPRLSSFLLAKAASASCRRVIAMSENAKLHLIRRNREDPSLKAVLEKTTVIHSSVEDHPETLEIRKRRESSEPFHLVFVGNEFFRKGGNLAVEAFEKLRHSFPLRLTVVSTLSENNTVYPVRPGETEEWRGRMMAAGVTVQRSGVRKALSTADLLLLPTLEDCYGYSMIEAMAAGVAVVATAVEAIPEIVEEGMTGLLIDVPVTEERRIVWSDEVGRRVVDQLVNRLERLLRQPEQIRTMGMRGRERYERLFRPDVVGRQLAEVYRTALGLTISEK